VWAAYEGVDDGSRDFGTLLDSISGPICYGSQNPSGFSMTNGTLSASMGSLCSTDLFLSPKDQDGASSCANGDHTWGPAWSAHNNASCPLDDPGSISTLGPKSSSPSKECNHPDENCVGFGEKGGLNTGTWGQAQNYMWMLVR
jgi:hypothetical protein